MFYSLADGGFLIRKSFIILIILISLPAALFGFGSREKDNSEKTLIKALNKYEKQWKNNEIKNYTKEIIYSRATFPPEYITITVSNNTVKDWTTNFKAKTLADDFIQSLSVEGMFKRARSSLKSKSNSPFEFRISFNEELGYVTNFSCIPASKNNRNITPVFDKNYRIEVILLKPAEANDGF
jgi:hypothetical protein